MNKEDRMPFDRDAQKTEQLKEVYECLVQIKTPLSFSDVRHIYRWLYRKQITVDMLSEEIIVELKETELYIRLMNSQISNNKTNRL